MRQLTGLKFEISEGSPFLRTGVTLASFQLAGNSPIEIDLLNILVSGLDSVFVPSIRWS